MVGTDLSKVGWVSQHVDVQELGHIPGSHIIVVTFEGRPDVGTLLVDQVTLILSCLAASNGPNEISHSGGGRHVVPFPALTRTDLS